MSIHQDQKVFTSGPELEESGRAVIMLHGRGATAYGMLQLADKLPEASYLAPQADRRTWYPQSFMEPREKNQPHLDSALEKVDSLVEKASEEVGTENVFLLGFSQGACLASEYTASNPGKYGGVFVLSGGLIGEELGEYSGKMEGTPIFLGCSEDDPHIPLERVEATAQVFQGLNAWVEKLIFEGSHHGIFDEEIERMNEIIES